MSLKDDLIYLHYPCTRKRCACNFKITNVEKQILDLIKTVFDNSLPITAEKTYFNDGVQSVLDKLQGDK